MTQESKLERSCKDCADLVDQFLSSSGGDTREAAKKQTRLSISIIEDAFQKHDIEEISLSFNGGKDCLVMLVIFLATLNRHRNYLEKLVNMPSVYVHFDNAFTEVDEFVDQCRESYGLEIVRLPPPLKDAFQTYLDKNSQIKVILVGIRRTDPYGDTLTYYERTDHGWPDFIRVHPVLEWHFVEIWDFLRHLKIPYCSLYDQGYTSLGGTTNTRKNPTLLLEERDADGSSMYRPAYELTDDDCERLSRIK